jgi:hypothetical protein
MIAGLTENGLAVWLRAIAGAEELLDVPASVPDDFRLFDWVV